MRLGVVEHTASTDKTQGGNDDEREAHQDQGEAVIAPERPREPLELQAPPGLERGRARHRQHEEVELLDDEAEGDDGNAGAHPGEESALIGGVVAIALDHDMPPVASPPPRIGAADLGAPVARSSLAFRSCRAGLALCRAIAISAITTARLIGGDSLALQHSAR